MQTQAWAWPSGWAACNANPACTQPAMPPSSTCALQPRLCSHWAARTAEASLRQAQQVMTCAVAGQSSGKSASSLESSTRRAPAMVSCASRLPPAARTSRTTTCAAPSAISCANCAGCSLGSLALRRDRLKRLYTRTAM
uniref:Uncharacterized protein n=1 Tax=uncultured bacterium TB308_p TaxID=1552139 RepID=A0A0K0LBK5_9BACT|nr:hypothetical protein [uncultured bacterium TB308_p]